MSFSRYSSFETVSVNLMMSSAVCVLFGFVISVCKYCKISCLNSEDRTIPFTCWLSFLNSSAAGKFAFSTIVAPASRRISMAHSKDAMIAVGTWLPKLFRGTPIVTPSRMVPLQNAVKSGIRFMGIFHVRSSQSLRPAILLSTYAASLTVLVSVPDTSWRFEIGIAPSVAMSPRDGLNPTTLLISAGSSVLPNVYHASASCIHRMMS